jgi:nitrite reductase/ring-hydroxylating ferredoxin subunit
MDCAAVSSSEQVASDDATIRTSDHGETVQTGDILAEVEQIINQLQAHPDAAVGELTTVMLNRIDAVHRAALTHLMGAIQSMAGDAFVNRLTSDPAIRLLLMSYDLLAVDRRTLAEEALDAVRGHLHAHGIDVELVDVLGGVVAVQMHGVPAGHPALDAARRDVEEALKAGLLGFQELEVNDGPGVRTAPADSVFLPLESLRRAQKPVFHSVFPAHELESGSIRSAIVNGVGVLLARVDDEFFAVRNACGQSPLPLDYSTLEGHELVCSWHACRYDIRTGRRLDWAGAAPEDGLRVLPVRAHDGMIELVVGTTSA